MLSAALLFSVVASMAACDADGSSENSGPVDVNVLCNQQSFEFCEKLAACGELDEPVADCTLDQEARCLDSAFEAQDSSLTCLENYVDAIIECSDRDLALTCEKFCRTSESGLTFCGSNCFYLCPEA